MIGLTQTKTAGFVSRPISRNAVVVRAQKSPVQSLAKSFKNKEINIFEDLSKSFKDIGIPLAGVALPLLFCDSAMAAEGQFGILEGRIFSLIHPVSMGLLFVGSLGAAYTGLQHRRTREIGTLIRDKKKEIPKKEEGDKHESPVEVEIKQLEADRKELTSKGFRDRHWAIGNALLGGGVTIAIYGALNTYLRLGKLFPGPHLFAGAGIVSLWAIAATLVPSMQKGNETARIAHISLNSLNILLFAWQIPTGIEILLKVLQFTKLP